LCLLCFFAATSSYGTRRIETSRYHPG
jgi:hypothetical protein